jgi:hypothetical protein
MSGIVDGRRPPKTIASIGTPSGSCQLGSMFGHCPAGAVNLEFGCAASRPQPGVQSLPFQSIKWAGGSDSDVREDRVSRHSFHGTRVGLPRSPRCNAEESSLWINRMQPAGLTRPQPCNIIADKCCLPSLFAILIGWDDHRQIRLAASARESSRQIGLCPIRGLEPHDQHVFR